jgi:integrase
MKGTTYQRKDGRWVGVADIGVDEKGKRLRKYVYGKKEKEVRTKLNEIIYDLQTNQYADAKGITLVELLNEFYKIKCNRWQETTASVYKTYIDSQFTPYFLKTKLADILPKTLDKFYNYKLDNGMSVNTVIKLQSFLNQAFKFAERNKYIKNAPTKETMELKKTKYSPSVYTEEDFKKLLAIVKGTFDEIPIAFASGGGLRRGEIFGLQWGDIDFSNSSITIKRAYVKKQKPYGWIIKSPKNETSFRSISVPTYLCDILKNKYESMQNRKIQIL